MSKKSDKELQYLKDRGELIYTFRLKRGINQSKLAKELGVHQSIISNAERGLFKKTQDKVILLIQDKYEIDPVFFSVDAAPIAEKVEELTRDIPQDKLEDAVRLIKNHTSKQLAQMQDQFKELQQRLGEVETKTRYKDVLDRSIIALNEIKGYVEKEKKINKTTLLKKINSLLEILIEPY